MHGRQVPADPGLPAAGVGHGEGNAPVGRFIEENVKGPNRMTVNRNI